jgi:hypothetical protein
VAGAILAAFLVPGRLPAHRPPPTSHHRFCDPAAPPIAAHSQNA